MGVGNKVKAMFWLVLFVVCGVFSISAAEFYFVLKAGETASYALLLEQVVSHDFAFGPGSGMEEIHWYWMSMPELNKIILGIHTVLAAIALTLAPTQFVGALRRRYPRWHKRVGYLSFCLGTSSMGFAIAYLCITPMDRTYGGPPFAVGLWGIAILTLYTYFAGVYHAIRGEMWQHFTIMTLNFCVLLIAPGLRLWWMAFGWLFEGLTQAEAHVAVLMFLGVQSMVLAIVSTSWLRFRHGRTSASVGGLRVLDLFRRGLPLLTLAGILCGGMLLNQSALKFVGSYDLFWQVTPTELFVTESDSFWSASWASWSYGVGSCLGLSLAPIVIWRLLTHREEVPVSLIDALFWVGVLSAGVGHMGRAVAFGTNWIRGWGGAFFEGTVGVCVLGFALVALIGLVRGDLRVAREYAIHSWALLLIPVMMSTLQTLFLASGFSFSDAYLSAAVISSSLCLSGSYYYTVYGSRPARLPVRSRGLTSMMDAAVFPV